MAQCKETRVWQVGFLFRALIPLGLALLSCREQNRLIPYPRTDADREFDAAANRPPAPKTLYAMARVLGKQGRAGTSQLVLRRIIQEHPDFMPAYDELAELYLRQCSVDDAIQVLSDALRVPPNQPVLANNLGVCWLLKKDYKRALEQFIQAAALAPQNERYRSNMAVALAMHGRYEEALALFMQVMSEQDAHHNVSILAAAKGDPPQELREAGLERRAAPLEAVGVNPQ